MISLIQSLPGPYYLSWAALPNLLAAVCLLLACYLALLGDHASPLSRRLAAFGSLMAYYFICFGVVYSASERETAYAWLRLAYLGVPFIPASVFDLTIHALSQEERRRRARLAFWWISALFAITNAFSSLLVDEARRFWWGYSKHYGPVGWLYTAYFTGVCAYSAAIVFKQYRLLAKGSFAGNRSSFFRDAAAVLCFAAVDFIHGFGPPVYPCGYLPILGFVWLISYGQHRYGVTLFNPSLVAQDILAAMHEALLVLDNAGEVILANASAVRLLEAGSPAVAMASAQAAFSPGFLRSLAEDVLADGQPREMETQLRMPCGRTIDAGVSASLSLSRSKAFQGIILTVADITQRKAAEALLLKYNEALEEMVRARTATLEREVNERRRAEGALRESEQKYRSVIENIQDIFCRTDGLGRLVMVSPSAVSLLGYRSLDELDGRPLDSLFLDPEEGAELARSIGRRGAVWDHEVRLARRDGSGLDASVNGAVYRDGDGRVLGLECIMRDVTERRVMTGRLRRSLEEKTLLLREVHHRVKNNFQMISNLLHVHAMKLPRGVVADSFAVMQNRLKSMALIHESLYQSKDLVDVDITRQLERIVTEIGKGYEEVSREVTVRLTVEPLPLDMEKGIACALLVNELVTNAFKHAFFPGRPGLLAIDLRLQDDDVVIAVEDNGCGLYDQSEATANGSLGMYIVQGLATQLRGGLDISSRPGGGARFVVRFPLQGPSRPPAPCQACNAT